MNNYEVHKYVTAVSELEITCYDVIFGRLFRPEKIYIGVTHNKNKGL